MPPFVLLLANLLVAAILVIAGLRGFVLRRVSRGFAGLALLPIADAVLLAAFVFGEDSYRDDGTSRWDAYRSPGGALGSMFAASLVLLGVSAAILSYAGLRERRGLFASTAVVSGSTAFVLLTATIIGFSAN